MINATCGVRVTAMFEPEANAQTGVFLGTVEQFHGGKKVQTQVLVEFPKRRVEFIRQALEKRWTVTVVARCVFPYQDTTNPAAPGLSLWLVASMVDFA
jgi:hypothetical protein